MARFKLSTLLLLLAVVAVLLAVVPLLTYIAVWDGRFQLNVTIESVEPFHAAQYDYFWKRDIAQIVLSGGEESDSWEFAQLSGSAFVLDLPCSGRINFYGHESSYSEPRYVVAKITLKNGEIVRKLIEVPQGRGARSVTISLP